PIAPEPVEIDDSKPEALQSAPIASKPNFHTHITETSSFYGFKGGGRSSTSFASTVGSTSNPRSEGGSEREMGPLSLASASSRRSSGFSGGGGVGGEKLSEQSDEEAFEEEDFEDDDERPTARPGRINDNAGR
ncbi:unnamed protein product, partial [Laminaria digitata]